MDYDHRFLYKVNKDNILFIGRETQHGDPAEMIYLVQIKDSTQTYSNIQEMKDKLLKRGNQPNFYRVIQEYKNEKGFGLVWDPTHDEFGEKPDFEFQINIESKIFRCGRGMIAYATSDYSYRDAIEWVNSIELIK